MLNRVRSILKRELIRLVERRSDVIRFGGSSVYPGELERALCSHPDIDVAVAFGVPHPTKREMPVAVVIPKVGADVDPDALLGWLRERLADHKAPRRIWIVGPDEIPSRSSRTEQRSDLRQRYRETFLQ